MTRRVKTYGLDVPGGRRDRLGRPAGAVQRERVDQGEGRRSADAPGAGPPQPAERARGRRGRSRAGPQFEQVATGLRDFRGAERRFEVRGEPRGILVVDDYGHHPTEIAAVIAAAKTLNRRIVVAFQPHRFTRTERAHGPVRAGAGRRRSHRPDRHLRRRRGAIRRRHARRAGGGGPAIGDRAGRDRAGLDDVVASVVRAARPGDVVVTLGAGSIGSLRIAWWRRSRERGGGPRRSPFQARACQAGAPKTDVARAGVAGDSLRPGGRGREPGGLSRRTGVGERPLCWK